jgi:hypothetical protein
MFNTKNVTEGSDYLQTGINHDVTIVSVVASEQEGKTPCIELGLAPSSNTSSVNTFRLYFSEKAAKYSLSRIKHLATKVVPESVIDNIQGANLADYSAKLNALLAGRRLRILLNGSEYVRQDGTVGVRTELPMMNFAEAIVDGAEYPSVSKENTALPDAKIQKLASTPSPTAKTSSGTEVDW